MKAHNNAMQMQEETSFKQWIIFLQRYQFQYKW